MVSHTPLAKRAQNVHQVLLAHFGYPEWRNPLPPLDELVSTILSQNTNDTNRDRAFETLRTSFPTWESVRDADSQAVVAAIRSAGLANQKGPRIQETLRQITDMTGDLTLDFLSELPDEEAYQWLMQFKGVGPKTASIVLLFSLNKPTFPVDTHIHRVTRRLGLTPKKMNAEQAHKHLAQLLSPQSYYAAHMNIIRLGREICKARQPECGICPLSTQCDYYLQNPTAQEV